MRERGCRLPSLAIARMLRAQRGAIEFIEERVEEDERKGADHHH